MIVRHVVLAALLASFPVYQATAEEPAVQADSPAHVQPVRISKAFHNRATRGGTRKSGGRIGTAGMAAAQATAQATTGWNFFHATNCYEAYGYLYIYPSEGGYWYTGDEDFKRLFAAECALGNLVAVYVTNFFGDFDQLWTYDYQ